MKIAICGAQGVGKTTLAQALSAVLKIAMLPEAATLALEAGYKLDKEASKELQFWILLKQFELQRASEHWISDRCYIDTIAYAQHLFFEDKSMIDVIRSLTIPKLSEYDWIIYLPAGEFPIADDGIRSTDNDWQIKIDRIIKELLQETGVRYITVTGTPDERIQKILKHLA